MKAIVSKYLSGLLICVSVFVLVFSEAQASSSTKTSPPPSGRNVEGQAKKLKINTKYKKEMTVDFDAANIEGQAKNPFASMVSQRDPNINSGFVKLRTHWHDQMIMSVSGLSQ